MPYSAPYKSYTNLRDFPVVNKQTYLGNYDSFRAPLDKIPGQRGDLHIQHTSGSTGTPFAIPQDTNCRTRRIAIIKAENELIGFHSFEPMMHLRSFSHYYKFDQQFVYNKDLNIWYANNSNLTEERIQAIVDIINKNRIKVIRGYMTTLDTITRYMEERGLRFNHSVTFISVGELLQEWLRQRIANYLNCRVISQYGNEEIGIFGSSDINGSGRHINLNGAGCVVEILKMDSDEPAEKGELGRIVATDFTNYAFPMIRYEIGDIAAPCEYYPDGSIKSIDNLSGRKTDMIHRTNGETVDMMNSLPDIIFHNEKIKQWQFIQKSEKQYQLRISFHDEAVKEEENAFKSSLRKVLGEDANITIDWVDEIPVLNSGKRKLVVNEWKR